MKKVFVITLLGLMAILSFNGCRDSEVACDSDTTKKLLSQIFEENNQGWQYVFAEQKVAGRYFQSIKSPEDLIQKENEIRAELPKYKKELAKNKEKIEEEKTLGREQFCAKYHQFGNCQYYYNIFTNGVSRYKRYIEDGQETLAFYEKIKVLYPENFTMHLDGIIQKNVSDTEVQCSANYQSTEYPDIKLPITYTVDETLDDKISVQVVGFN